MENESVVEAGLPEFVIDPIGMLQRRWLAVLATLVVGVAATALVTLTRTPLYSAKATVMLISQKIPEELVRPTVELERRPATTPATPLLSGRTHPDRRLPWREAWTSLV